MNKPNYFAIFSFVLMAGFCAAQDFNAKWVIPPVITEVDSITYSPNGHESLLITWKSRLQGVVDQKNNLILKPEYNWVKLYPSGWINGAKNKASYWYTERGKPVLDTIEKAVFSNSNYLVVSKEGKWGAVDNQGQVKIPIAFERYVQQGNRFVFFKGSEETELNVTPNPEFPAVQREMDKKAKALLTGYYLLSQNKKSGFLNAKGDTIIPMIYHFGAIHPEGYIAASLEPNKWGVIDKNHKTLKDFTAEGVGQWTKSRLLPIRENNRWGLGRFPENTEVFPFGKYEQIEVFDKDKDWFMVTLGGKKGVVDVNGTVLLPVEYTYVTKNDTRIALLMQDRLLGYWIPSLGKREEPAYREIDVVNDTICVVRTDSMAAVLDVVQGKAVIPPQKGFIKKWSGYYILSKNYEKFFAHRYLALFDMSFKPVFERDSAVIHIFSDRSFLMETATIPSKNTEHHNAKGELLRSWKPFSAFHRDNCWIRVNPDYRKNSYFISSDPVGQEFYYEDVSKAVENVHIVMKDKLYGLVSSDGKVLAPPVLDAALPSKEGCIRVKYQGKWGVLQNPAYVAKR